MKPHKACNFSIRPVSRGDGRSAVAAAAYRAGTRLYDERTGRVRNYRSKRDVMSVEMVGWDDTPEAMWNLVEKCETRINARVARDFVISLPAELPHDAQVKLARGYALWLRDRYGTPSMMAIHSPVGHAADPCRDSDEEILEGLRPQFRKARQPKGDPRNHHVHILTPTRSWDAETKRFGKKVRQIDDKKEGPIEVRACREEWQKRVNSMLEKHGVAERVDLRSYADMVSGGDAPEGLVPQPKRGPSSTARSRRLARETGGDTSLGGVRQKEIRETNEGLWENWLLLQHLRRQQARDDGTSEKIAAAREAERRRQADADRAAIMNASTVEHTAAAIEDSQSFDLAPNADPWRSAILDAQDDQPEAAEPNDEFNMEIDPETYDNPDTKEAPRFEIRVRERVRQRVRQRG